jgi:hypothetical protein
MFLARGTRAPRCDRCGRITAPYPSCRACSSLASASAPAPAAPDSSLEDLIAAALPGASAVASSGSYDPEDVSIPRDPDVFIGSGGGSRWRRMF